MYMDENKNIGGKQWVGLDFKIASDYTHGSPEEHRTRLRQMIGLPNLYPGEKTKSENQQSIRSTKRSTD
jgi:hypothetical protein